MDKTWFQMFGLVGASVMWMAMLAWWFWEYVDAVIHRKDGESLLKALERGSKERALNQQARNEMFGARWITIAASTGSFAMNLLLLSLLVQGKLIGFVLGAYLLIGFVVGAKMNFKAHRSWGRLGIMDKLSFRWAHAWLWPAHVVAKSKTGSGQ